MVQARPRGIRVQEFAHHSQQVIERDKQRPTQCHRHRLLRGRQRRLDAVRRVTAILEAVAVPPLVNGLLRDPETSLAICLA